MKIIMFGQTTGKIPASTMRTSPLHPDKQQCIVRHDFEDRPMRDNVSHVIWLRRMRMVTPLFQCSIYKTDGLLHEANRKQTYGLRPKPYSLSAPHKQRVRHFPS